MPTPDKARNPWSNVPDDNPTSFGNTGSVITPSDTVDLTSYAKSIVITAAGNIVVIPAGNLDANPITFTGVPVGFVIPYRVRRVNATGTTASAASIDR